MFSSNLDQVTHIKFFKSGAISLSGPLLSQSTVSSSGKIMTVTAMSNKLDKTSHSNILLKSLTCNYEDI
ncbi:hypothetical protein A0J61_08528 [Choanephora cucurbitarum]|uniref:Uncharacterized protein n=1 Tax=Choanephora cucurbitarum TaxID=101091 RepID=A0A1C7N2T2_9FUNG|nr:hypothetical protein A0J61_08528 [Choanephora cucurbitarum]